MASGGTWWYRCRSSLPSIQPLQALKRAGAELFDFDIALMLAEYRNNAPENFSYIYEMPREISR